MKIVDIESVLDYSSKRLEEIQNSGDKGDISTADNIKKKLQTLLEGVKDLEENNSLLTIGIVGQMKVGKSSFLNALLFEGEPVLPKAATPMTAGLTVISHTDKPTPYIEVDYYSQDEWKTLEHISDSVKKTRAELLKEEPSLINNEDFLERKLKELVGERDFASYQIVSMLKPEARGRIGKPTETVPLLSGNSYVKSLENFVGANGKFTSVVKSMKIYLNHPVLEQLRIVDTPGVNDPVSSRDAETMKFLREAHGVLMLMDASAFMTGCDIDFMNNRLGKEGISTIVVVGNKLDILCFGGKYRNEWEIERAVKEIKDKLGALYNEKIPLFNYVNAVKGVVFTSGMADSILQKFEKSDNYLSLLDEDETFLLQNLKKYFPADFSEDNVMDSLALLTDSQSLYDDYIQKEFISRKDEVIDEKTTAFMEEHKKDVISSLDFVIGEINDELVILKKESSDSLDGKMKQLQQLLHSAVPALQIRIQTFIMNLQACVNKEFQTTLVSKKPSFSSIPTELYSKEYTREGTRLGFEHSGVVAVSRLNSDELCKDEDRQVEKLRGSVFEFWNNLFDEEKKALRNDMLDKITEISTKGADAYVSDEISRNLINKLIDNELRGLENIDVNTPCEDFKATFKKTMESSSFIDLRGSYGEMKESEAEEKIRKEAKSNLSTAASQVVMLNNSFYKELEEICMEQCRVASSVLENFKSQLQNQISSEINTQLQLLQTKLRSKEDSIKGAEKRREIYQNIKNKFVAL